MSFFPFLPLCTASKVVAWLLIAVVDYARLFILMSIVLLFVPMVASIVAVGRVSPRVRPRVPYRFTSILLTIRNIRPLGPSITVRFLVFLSIPPCVIWV